LKKISSRRFGENNKFESEIKNSLSYFTLGLGLGFRVRALVRK
jgi:hypothetical protein